MDPRGDHSDHGDGERADPRASRRQCVQGEEPQEPGDAVDDQHVERQHAGECGAPRRHAREGEGGDDDQDGRPEEHLPRGQRQHVDLVAALHDLDHHGAARPAQAPCDRHQAGRYAVQLPGRDDEDEADERQPYGGPLQSAHPFAEERPRQEQQPERHGVGEHRRLSRPGVREGPHRAGDEAARLQEADEHCEAESDWAQGSPEREQESEEAEHREYGSQGRKGVRFHVVQADLGQHPSVAPDEGQSDQGRCAEVAPSGVVALISPGAHRARSGATRSVTRGSDEGSPPGLQAATHAGGAPR